jgi:hypothetical protein
MPNAFLVAGMIAAVVVALALVHLFGRRRDEPVSFADEREETLTRQLAAMVGCSPARALPWVRKEMQIAPNQTDDNLVKRAAYQYRRSQPDATCAVWRNRGR